MYKIFIGDDEYSMEEAIKKEAKLFGVANYTVLTESTEIIDALNSQSFFEEKRVFVAKNILKGLPKKEESLIAEQIGEKLRSDLVIFIEDEERKSSQLIKKAINENLLVRFFSKSRNLVDFIKEQVAKEEGNISPLAAERLASMVGADLFQLKEEIRKLALYKKDTENETIENSDVDEIVRSNTEANIFNLIDAYAQKNKKRTAELVRMFIDSGENSIYILAMIHRQLRNIAIVVYDKSVTESMLVKRVGLHPFVAKKTIQQAKKFSKSDIIESYQKIIKADYKLKSGADPEQTLYLIFA